MRDITVSTLQLILFVNQASANPPDVPGFQTQEVQVVSIFHLSARMIYILSTLANSALNFKTAMVPAAGADVDTVTLSVAVVAAVAVAADGGHAKLMLWRLQLLFLSLL